MNKFALLAIALLLAGGYFYRDQFMPSIANHAKGKSSAAVIYTWKDQAGKTHYSSDKSAAPANAKAADLPEISILETDRDELEKQAQRLKEKERPPESADTEKPKLPQVRNLALEKMEKAADNMKK